MADFLTSGFFVSSIFLVSNKHQGTIFSQFVTLKKCQKQINFVSYGERYPKIWPFPDKRY